MRSRASSIAFSQRHLGPRRRSTELQAVLDDAAKLALHRAQVGLAQILDLPDQVGSVELGVRPELGQAPRLARLIARPGIEVLAVKVLHAARHRSFH